MDIISDWAYIEADFLREYGINLVEELGKMSWRKFLVLLRGLSREAVFVIVNTDQTSDGTQIVDGESDEASSIVKSFFG